MLLTSVIMMMMMKNDSVGSNNANISDTEDDMNDELTLQWHLLCGFVCLYIRGGGFHIRDFEEFRCQATAVNMFGQVEVWPG